MKVLLPILIFLISTYGLQGASAQLSSDLMLEQMKRQGLENCELVELLDRMYVPVRIELFHEPVVNQIIETSSSDPASELFFEKSESRLGLITNSTDNFMIKVQLDYKTKEEKSRQVGYSYQSENYMLERGNWNHEGIEFCKIFQVNTSVAPHIPTSAEILDIAGKITKEKFDSVSRQLSGNTDMVFIFVLMILAFSGLVIILMITNIVARARDSRKANRLKNEQAEEYRIAKEKLDQAIALTNLLYNQGKNLNEKFDSEINELIGEIKKEMSILRESINSSLITILHVKKQIEVRDAGLSEKLQSGLGSLADQIPFTKSKEINIDEIKKKKISEIKEIYNKMIDKHGELGTKIEKMKKDGKSIKEELREQDELYKKIMEMQKIQEIKDALKSKQESK